MKKYIGTMEICEKYNVTRNTVMLWRKEGLPFAKIGERSIIYDPEEVDKWIAERIKKFT